MNSLEIHHLRRGQSQYYNIDDESVAPTQTLNNTTYNTTSRQSKDRPKLLENYNLESPCLSNYLVKDSEMLVYLANHVQENQLQHTTHDCCAHDYPAPPLSNENSQSISECNVMDEGSQGQQVKYDTYEKAKLKRMTKINACAIALHNFPDGCVIFVVSVYDPRVGAVLAIGIALHNIPVGLCVALSMFYATTGRKWNALAWACVSGASGLLAALLGWAILANSFSVTLNAVLFGMVAGMMVSISVRELLPTAHRYDSEDCVVTNSFIVGMMIMAFSLVLFADEA